MSNQKTELFPGGNNLISGVGGIHSSLLRYPELNFVKVRKDGKGCLEFGWPGKIRRSDDYSLNYYLRNGGDIGVQTNNSIVAGKQLIIIDFDKRELQDKVLHLFPKTFSTTSGSAKNCLHLWLATDKHEKKFAIKNKERETMADILGRSGQVLAPGSKHPSGSVYRVINDLPIAFIPYEKILEILMPYHELPPTPQRVSKPRKNYGTNSFYDSVLSKLNVVDVLEKHGIDTSKSRTSCPLKHSSESEECLSFNEECWKCHNCGESGNLFQLVQKIDGLNTRETFEKLAEMSGLEDELKEQQRAYMRRGGA